MTTDVTTPEYGAQCAYALQTGLTRKGLVKLAIGMPYLSQASKRDIATWLVRYRPEAVKAIGWLPPVIEAP